MFKKILKSKKTWIILLVIIGVIVFIVYKFLAPKELFDYVTETIKRGSVVQTVTATGIVESSNEISLNFKTPGRLVILNVKEGQKVEAGQVLAAIDASSVNAMVSQYRASLASAQSNLDRVKAGASIEDIDLVKQQLVKAENDYNSLLRDSQVQTVILKEKIVDSLSNSIFTSQTALNTIFNDLINKETTYNLLLSDDSLKNRVINNYYIIREEFDFLKNQVDLVKNSNNQDEIIATADSMRNFLGKLNDFLNDAFLMSDRIILNTAYSQVKKDSIKSSVNSQQTIINSSLISLQSNRTALINHLSNFKTQTQSASNSVAIARSQLNLKTAGARDFEIASAQAQVAQAQASLDKILSEIQDYYIKAPINGIITKVNYTVGENALGGQPVINMLGDDKYEVKIDIPESDITKIKVGEKAFIELDAFGSDYRFDGVVTFIDPAQTIIRDVTYYKIRVSFSDDSWDDQIKPGMTANITIIANEKEDVLFIPQRAVKVRETTLDQLPQRFVEILVDNQVIEKSVLTGLRGDNGLVEIVDGLNEGDQVIISKRERK